MHGNLVVGSNDAVLRYAQRVLTENGVQLSTHVLGFFIRLVNLVYYHGEPVAGDDNDIFCLYCTPLGLSEHMTDFAGRRITLMLSQLAEGGLITYEPNVNVPEDMVFGEKPFKKSKPFRVTINLKEVLFMDLNAIMWFFNDEERYVLNQGAWQVSRRDYCDQISFLADPEDDDMGAVLMRELCEKIQTLSDEQWNHIQQYFPLPTTLDDEEFDESVWEREGVEV